MHWGLADALGSVRAEIAALRQREAELRAAILASPVCEDGVEFRAIVRRGVSRRLNCDALPAHILDNPDYWVERQTTTVVTRFKTRGATTTGGLPGSKFRAAHNASIDEHEVLEPF